MMIVVTFVWAYPFSGITAVAPMVVGWVGSVESANLRHLGPFT